MDVTFLLDGVIALLLAVTATYCFLLDRRLKALRDGRDGLKALIAELADQTARADAAMKGFAAAAEATGARLDEKGAKAKGLGDELALMIEAGESLAKRLEGQRGEGARNAPAQPLRNPASERLEGLKAVR